MGTGPARALVATSAAALALAVGALAPATATASLPDEGVLARGKSLGGLRIGMTRKAVRRAWGTGFGRCRDCATETWYFTYRRHAPQGAAVAFQGGRVVRVYTLWQPPGWRTWFGLLLGAREPEVVDAAGDLPRRECNGYSALVARGSRADSVLYLYAGGLWGLGLIRSGLSPCL